MTDGTEWTWDDVERLLSDLKSDGYTPLDLETNTSHAAPEKTVFLDVGRPVDADTDRSNTSTEGCQ
jgi:hypothetical protein